MRNFNQTKNQTTNSTGVKRFSFAGRLKMLIVMLIALASLFGGVGALMGQGHIGSHNSQSGEQETSQTSSNPLGIDDTLHAATTVTLDANGGTISGNSTASYSMTYPGNNTAITNPDARTGYTHKGWYIDASSAVTINGSSDATTAFAAANTSTTVSISFSAYMNDWSGISGYIVKGGASGGAGYNITATSVTIYATNSNTSLFSYGTSSTISYAFNQLSSGWHDVCVRSVYSSSTSTRNTYLHIDGVQVGSSTSTGANYQYIYWKTSTTSSSVNKTIAIGGISGLRLGNFYITNSNTLIRASSTSTRRFVGLPESSTLYARWAKTFTVNANSGTTYDNLLRLKCSVNSTTVSGNGSIDYSISYGTVYATTNTAASSDTYAYINLSDYHLPVLSASSYTFGARFEGYRTSGTFDAESYLIGPSSNCYLNCDSFGYVSISYSASLGNHRLRLDTNNANTTFYMSEVYLCGSLGYSTMTVQMEDGEEAYWLITPIRSGYTFAGWTLSNENAGVLYGNCYVPNNSDESQTITAQWISGEVPVLAQDWKERVNHHNLSLDNVSSYQANPCSAIGDYPLTVNVSNGSGNLSFWVGIDDTVLLFTYYGDEQEPFYLPVDSSYIFEYTEASEFLNCAYIDTSAVKNMKGLFEGSSGLVTGLSSIGSWDTSNVTNMYEMFYNCSGLAGTLNLSNWNTSSVEDMTAMFYNCSSLTSINISNWSSASLSRVTHYASFANSSVLYGMFNGCSSLVSLTSGNSFTLSGVDDARGMFLGCTSLRNVDCDKFRFSDGTNIGGMFSGCSSLTSLNLSGWDFAPSAVVYTKRNAILPRYTYYGLFGGCSGLESINFGTHINMTNVTSVMNMFNGCTNLRWLDLSSFNFSSCENYSNFLLGCTNLAKLYAPHDAGPSDELDSYDFSSLGTFTASYDSSISGTTFADLFDYSDWYYNDDYEPLYYMYRADKVVLDQYWFVDIYDDGVLTPCDVTSLTTTIQAAKPTGTIYDVSEEKNNLVWAQISGTAVTIYAPNTIYLPENADEIFGNGSDDEWGNYFENITSLDLTNYRTDNTTSMNYLFDCCTNLQSITFPSGFGNSATHLGYIFIGCRNLDNLILPSGFGGVATDISGAFYDCDGMTSLTLPAGFGDECTSANIVSVFSGCSSLEFLDLSGCDWSSHTGTKSNMFTGCTSLRLLKTPSAWGTNQPTLPYSSSAGDIKFFNVDGTGTAYDSNSTSLPTSATLGRAYALTLNHMNTGVAGTSTTTAAYGVYGSGYVRLQSNGSAVLSRPTRDGYSFLAWYDAPSGGNSVLSTPEDGSLIPESFIIPSAVTNYTGTTPYTSSNIVWTRTNDTGVLYAQWTANSYNIYVYDGKNIPSSTYQTKQATYGSAYPSVTVPSYAGYGFDGYCLATDCSELSTSNFSSNGKYVRIGIYENGYSGNRTWNGNKNLVQVGTVVYFDITYTNMNNNFESISIEDEEVSPARYVRDGNRVYGSWTVTLDTWIDQYFFLDINLGAHNNTGTVTINALYVSTNATLIYNSSCVATNATYTYTNDITVIGKWTPTNYTLTLDVDGGSIASGWTLKSGETDIYEKSYNIETAAFTLPTPTKSGYTFGGWKITTTAGNWAAVNSDVADGASISGKYGDATLTAQWSVPSKPILAKDWFTKLNAGLTAASQSTVSNTQITQITSIVSADVSGYDVSDDSAPNTVYATYSAGTITFRTLGSTIYLPEDSGYIFSTGTGTWNSGLYFTALETVILTNFNSSDAIYISNIFYGCSSLETLTGINSLDVSNVKNLSGAFGDCSSLETLNISSWAPTNLEWMSSTFYGCSSLTSLNISGLTYNKLTDGLISTFRDMTSIETIGFGSSYDLNLGSGTKVLDYWESLFQGCTSLVKIDLSGFDFSSGRGYDLLTDCINLKEIITPYASNSNADNRPEFPADMIFYNQTDSSDTTAYSATNANWPTTSKSLGRAYALTLNANGGTISGNATASAYGVYGSQYVRLASNGSTTLPTPTRTGYTLSGVWYDATNGGNQVVAANGVIPSGTVANFTTSGLWTRTNDTGVVYAQWSANRYLITLISQMPAQVSSDEVRITGTTSFYAEYGSSTKYSASTGNSTITYTEPSVELDGYPVQNFYGWYVTENGETIVVYTNGAFAPSVSGYTDSSGQWIGTSAVTLYGYWEANEFTISFYSQDGEDFISGCNAYYGDTLSYDPGIQVKASTNTETFTFVGWATSTNQTSGTLFANLPVVTSDVDYYAAFSASPRVYTITYNSNGGSSVSAQNYDSTTNVTLAGAPIYVGHTFTGWLLSSAVGNWSATTYTASQEIGTGKYGNVTLVAQWSSPSKAVLNKNWLNIMFDDGWDFEETDIITITSVVSSIPNGLIADVTDVSDDDYPNTVYVYFDDTDGTITFYTLLSTIYLPEDSSAIFGNSSGYTNLDYIGLNNFNTSDVTNMSLMFYNDTALEGINVSGFDMTNVTNIAGMFCNCSSLQTLDLSDWATDSLEIVYSFYRNKSSVLFNYGLFTGCTSLETITFGGDFDVSGVSNLSAMFYSCSSLQSLDLSNWNVSNVTSIGAMFFGCSSLQTLDLSDWTTGTLIEVCQSSGYGGRKTYMGLFAGCSSLVSLDISSLKIDNVSLVTNMFAGCDALLEIVTPAAVSLDYLPEFPADMVFCNKTNANDTTLYSYEDDNFPTTSKSLGRAYTLTLNYNDGATPTTVDAYGVYNSAYVRLQSNGSTTLPTPTRTGYTLSGVWYDATSGGNQVVAANGVIPSGTVANFTTSGLWTRTNDTGVVYAQWTAGLFTITLDNADATTNGTGAVYEEYGVNVWLNSNKTNAMTTDANGITIPQRAYTVTYNYKYDTANTTDTATYTFAGYYDSSTQMIDANGYKLAAFTNTYFTANASLNAHWSGGSITLPTPLRAGYEFGGWYSDSDATTTKVGDGGDSYAPTEAITLYAKWTAIIYTIHFDKNGGSGTCNDVTGIYGASITLPTTTKTGYAFLGWCENETDDNGTGEPVAWTTMPAFPTTEITLYAKWQINTHTITVYSWFNSASNTTYRADDDCVGGTVGVTGSGNSAGASDSKNADYNSSVTVVATAQANYTFEGWYTTSDFGTLVSSSASYTFTLGDSNVNLYAKFTVQTSTVTAIFPSDCSIGVTDGATDYRSNSDSATQKTFTFKAGSTPEFTITPPTGYKITVITVDGTPNNQDGSAGAKTYTFASLVANSAHTLNITTAAIGYTITYKDQGDVAYSGSNLASLPTTHTYGTATVLVDGVKTGYRFEGWYTASDCASGLVTTLGATDYTANITLYAKWTQAVAVTIVAYPTSNDVAGTLANDCSTSGTYYVGDTLTLKAITNDGYSFWGWRTEIGNGYPYLSGSYLPIETTYTITAADAANGTLNIYAAWLSRFTLHSVTNFSVADDVTGGRVRVYNGWDWDSENTGIHNNTQATSTNQQLYSGSNATFNSTHVLASSGYVFYGYYEERPTQANFQSLTHSTSVTWDGTKEWYALFLSQPTLTLDAQGGSIPETTGYSPAGATETKTKSVVYGEQYGTLPTPTRDGYTFDGWYGENKFDINSYVLENSSIYRFTNNLTIGKTYKLTSNKELSWFKISTSASGYSSVQSYGPFTTYQFVMARDEHISESSTQYIILGLTSIGSGTSGKLTTENEAQWADLEIKIEEVVTSSTIVTETSNHTLYAQWTPTDYTITYDSNGGSSVAAQNYDITTDITLADAPTRLGYDFDGWLLASDVGNWSATTYTASQAIGTGKYGDITLVAQWSAIEYTITYTNTKNNSVYVNGVQMSSGDEAEFPTQTYTIEDNLTLYLATKRYCSTVWWRVTETTGSWTLNTTYQMNARTLGTGNYGDISIALNWTWDTYTVIFAGTPYSDEVEVANRTTVSYNGTLATLPSPTFTGFTFDGWYGDTARTKPSGGIVAESTQFNSSVFEDGFDEENQTFTIYAKWVPKTVRVTINSTGTYSGATFDYSYDDELDLSDDSRPGYSFDGYYLESTYVNEAVNGTKLNTSNFATMTYDSVNDRFNLTVYSKFTQLSYTLTLNGNGGSIPNTTGYTPSGASETKTTTVHYGDTLTLPTPTKDYYRFVGWKYTEDPVDEWDGSTSTAPSGDGTLANPYRIVSGANLKWISDTLANGDNTAFLTFKNKYFVQEKNIDLKGYNWTPIGIDYNHAFAGNYDGNGKFIANVNVSNDNIGNVAYYGGLFGVLGNYQGTAENKYSVANISNLIIKNISIDVASIYTTKQYNLGGLAGVARYTTVDNVRIVNLSINVASQRTTNLGGIVGVVNKANTIVSITNCAVDGIITPYNGTANYNYLWAGTSGNAIPGTATGNEYSIEYDGDLDESAGYTEYVDPSVSYFVETGDTYNYTSNITLVAEWIDDGRLIIESNYTGCDANSMAFIDMTVNGEPMSLMLFARKRYTITGVKYGSSYTVSFNTSASINHTTAATINNSSASSVTLTATAAGYTKTIVVTVTKNSYGSLHGSNVTQDFTASIAENFNSGANGVYVLHAAGLTIEVSDIEPKNMSVQNANIILISTIVSITVCSVVCFVVITKNKKNKKVVIIKE